MKIREDYIAEELAEKKPQLHEHWHWLGLSITLPVIFLVLALSTHDADASRPELINSNTSLSEDVRNKLADLASGSDNQNNEEDTVKTALGIQLPLHYMPLPEDWQELSIRRNDTLSVVFSRNNLPRTDWIEMLSLGGEATQLKTIRAGESLRIRKDENGQLTDLLHRLDDERTLHFSRVDGKFQSIVITSPLSIHTNEAYGTVSSSLFLSGKNAGLSDRIIMQMVDVLGWDIDFALDIRQGDTFKVIYEELYRNKTKVRDGKIIALEFINGKRKIQALHYTDPEGNAGYYSVDGSPMRKAFLRTPVDFARISSHFNLRRRHPVLNRIRAHKGVDYAAGTGTPIKATGDGRIILRGRHGGYGNCIVIQHAGKYTTLYGHMSRFRGGLRNGSRVKQGQIIGYVGSTGLATGPHLHYEFRINGRHVNPLTVELPTADPLPAEYMEDFKSRSSTLAAKLDTLGEEIQVAASK